MKPLLNLGQFISGLVMIKYHLTKKGCPLWRTNDSAAEVTAKPIINDLNSNILLLINLPDL